MQFENITYLFGAYFHQDWFYDDPTYHDVIARFLSRESYNRCLALKQEIIVLISSEKDIPQEFISEHNGYYDPTADGLTVKEWLKSILSVLSSDVK